MEGWWSKGNGDSESGCGGEGRWHDQAILAVRGVHRRKAGVDAVRPGLSVD